MFFGAILGAAGSFVLVEHLRDGVPAGLNENQAWVIVVTVLALGALVADAAPRVATGMGATLGAGVLVTLWQVRQEPATLAVLRDPGIALAVCCAVIVAAGLSVAQRQARHGRRVGLQRRPRPQPRHRAA